MHIPDITKSIFRITGKGDGEGGISAVAVFIGNRVGLGNRKFSLSELHLRQYIGDGEETRLSKHCYAVAVSGERENDNTESLVFFPLRIAACANGDGAIGLTGLYYQLVIHRINEFIGCIIASVENPICA